MSWGRLLTLQVGSLASWGLAGLLWLLAGAGPAQAQVGGLYWQCVAPGSANPQGTFCPASTTYPLPTTTENTTYTDLGPCQLTVGNSATGLTGGTGICSGGIPAGATIAVITVETQPMRWTGTGATNPPTQSFGSLQAVGTSFTYSAALANFRMNDTASGSSTVDVEFFK